LSDVDARLDTFPGEVGRQFRFLVDRYGFTALESVDKCCVGYAAPPWTIWIIIDGSTRTVDTYICHDDGSGPLRLPLDLLLRYRGVPAQLPRTSAQTARAVVRSLGLQAKALASVLPTLMAPGGRQALCDAAGNKPST
jgi:hypothetical protein